MTTTDTLTTLFIETRALTEKICKPLEIEDYVVQPMLDTSPPKWHLGHTTWFYEEFILKHFKPNYKLFHDDFAFVFNSYYETLGKRVIRNDRGNLSRPGVAKVYDYRHYITNEMKEFLASGLSEEVFNQIEHLLLMGIHHEKQHQELLTTDIKYILGNNPLLPKYGNNIIENKEWGVKQEWIKVSEGIYNIGHKETDEFHYDIEIGRHKVYLHEFEISNKAVTNGEYLEFIEAGGYKDFNFWHADGWEWLKKTGINKPMYWHIIDNKPFHYTLKNGLEELNLEETLAHVSYYEAFAYAQWKGYRLPTEFEWEAGQQNFKWGERWEWTESALLPYPNYVKAPGAIGEYNGKFMVNQKVLRGGSTATAPKHTRYTYRNFFLPDTRWQYSGIRLAK